MTIILTTQSQIASATTADLIATYNKYTGKTITRFSSRSAGEAQTAMAILKGQDNAAHAGVPKGTDVIAPAAPGAKEAEPVIIPAKKAATTTAKPAAKSAMASMADTVTKPKPDLKLVDPGTMLKKGFCPLCGGDDAQQVPAGKEGTVAGDERNQCKACGNEYWRVGPKAGQVFARRTPGRDAGSAIASTWTDEEVRAARSLKQRVQVGDQQYRSVREAFEKLGLPLNKHIKFRMELKATEKATFAHDGTSHKFVIVKVAA